MGEEHTPLQRTLAHRVVLVTVARRLVILVTVARSARTTSCDRATSRAARDVHTALRECDTVRRAHVGALVALRTR